ncbi:hypothetical protein QTJ16_003249 [Diplocarpon rosae]|uniref:Uncharacterized protein n=1 Tax=Diplocarpon rosae TaxID=946125 RepID=A0AAD9T1V4_9HELO|nr:hypothetical protein QTJ16_003249 [Diplocarpon rosae]PBP25372.1 hypothetical protein BUE80_DR003792 [Diplocarpon rosae]
MAPNLLLAAKKAVSPWEWCQFQPSDTMDKNPKLYHRREPIRGIYAKSNNKRYLLAIKPNRKPFTDHIFPPKPSSSAILTTSVQYQKIEDEDGFETTIKIMESSLSKHSFITKTCRHRISIIRDALPHAKSTFGIEGEGFVQNSASSSLTSLLISKIKDTIGINQLDLHGYKFLANPLEVEFNDITNRWMFSSEVQARTIVRPMCKSLTCMEKDMTVCGKQIQRTLFCLDDGISWVVIGDVKHGVSAKRKTGAYKASEEYLYAIDEDSGNMRRQSVTETRESETRLVERAGGFLIADENEGYVSVLKYLGIPIGDAQGVNLWGG